MAFTARIPLHPQQKNLRRALLSIGEHPAYTV